MLLWFSAYAWVQSTKCLSPWLPVVVGQLTHSLQGYPQWKHTSPTLLPQTTEFCNMVLAVKFAQESVHLSKYISNIKSENSIFHCVLNTCHSQSKYSHLSFPSETLLFYLFLSVRVLYKLLFGCLSVPINKLLLPSNVSNYNLLLLLSIWAIWVAWYIFFPLKNRKSLSFFLWVDKYLTEAAASLLSKLVAWQCNRVPDWWNIIWRGRRKCGLDETKKKCCLYCLS